MLLFVAACDRSPRGQAPAEAGFVDLDMLTVDAGQGVFAANRNGAVTRIMFPVDLTRVDPAKGHSSDRIGATDGGVVIMRDEYGSKAEDGANCAGGKEVFVRAFSLSLSRQIAEFPVSSCLSATGKDVRAVDWVAPDRFRITGKRATTYRIVGADQVIAER